MDEEYSQILDESVDLSQLLPRSGIGAQGPYLLIAAPGNPLIRLDARQLDSIELVERGAGAAFAVAGLAAAGLLAGALSLIPGGLFTCAGMAYLAHDRLSEARRRRRSRDLLLTLGDLPVALHVEDEPALVRRLADSLSPYTRAAPITRPEVYEDARRRLQTHGQERSDSEVRRELAGSLTVGAEVVQVVDDYLCIGATSFAIDEVRDCALRGANLPLSGSRSLQAALGLLVVAADERAREGEDVATLTRRIKEYEDWTGRTAGR
ncbi:hypothetical protein [Haliangium ochraceum]|uniref:Uncharacterized protein n=1 Tax=Haliangium ochraceum (strain DSM 14365 / JCM 11303 / SMP-2) TaxID=502025 RepID=D0LG73_HALO1|nr:hypothetical protein [Haliangium ochraceum]ACY18098.1 hypothetical protein Hoch_5618 [Haliangium ochraceum DSM 14365]